MYILAGVSIRALIVGISIPMEVKSRIVNGVSVVPSDGTDKNYNLPSVRSSIIRKPTYAEIVGKTKHTDRRISIRTNR